MEKVEKGKHKATTSQMCLEFHIRCTIRCLLHQVRPHTLVLEVSNIKRGRREPACSPKGVKPCIPWETPCQRSRDTLRHLSSNERYCSARSPSQTRGAEGTRLMPCCPFIRDRGQGVACQEWQAFLSRFVLEVLNFNRAMSKTILLLFLGHVFVGINLSETLLCLKIYMWIRREVSESL